MSGLRDQLKGQLATDTLVAEYSVLEGWLYRSVEGSLVQKEPWYERGYVKGLNNCVGWGSDLEMVVTCDGRTVLFGVFACHRCGTRPLFSYLLNFKSSECCLETI